MAIVIFALSGVTATLCSGLLFRGYRRNGVRLLFWAGICFAALALEAAVLIINEYTTMDLTILRLAIPQVGLIALLYGLLWESELR
jgi:hypothetical protein